MREIIHISKIVAQWLECWPPDGRVYGSIPSQRQTIGLQVQFQALVRACLGDNQSISLSLSFSFFLSPPSKKRKTNGKNKIYIFYFTKGDIKKFSKIFWFHLSTHVYNCNFLKETLGPYFTPKVYKIKPNEDQ